MLDSSSTPFTEPIDVTGLSDDLLTQQNTQDSRLSGTSSLDCYSEQDFEEILGTFGRDILQGTDANERIIGGFGRDLLNGGEGTDLFVYQNLRDAGDIITGFELQEDKIDLTDVLTGFGYTGVDPLGDGYVSLQDYNGGTQVLLDQDGLGGRPGRPFIFVETVTADELGSFKEHFCPHPVVENQAPSISLDNIIESLNENRDTTNRIELAEIIISDDGEGQNTLDLSGEDAEFFEIVDDALFLKSGVDLDFENKSSYQVNVIVDDVEVGKTPDDTVTYTLEIVKQLTINAALANDTGVSDVDRITLDPTVEGEIISDFEIVGLQGSFNGNEFIDISDALNDDGSFTIGLEQYDRLSEGAFLAENYEIALKGVDSAGNESAIVKVAFTLDRTAPEITLGLDPDSDTGEQGDNTTTERTVNLVGETEPGLSVVLVETQQAVTADSEGNFSFANVSLPTAGETSFSVVVEDLAGNQGRAQEFFTREGINGAPEIISTPETVFDTTQSDSYTYQIEAIDPDDDLLTYTLLNLVPGAELDETGLLSFTPSGILQPSYEFTLEVSDGRGGVDSQIFTLELPNIQNAQGEIRGIKWDDLNGNGIQETNENGLAGVSVYLDANNNERLDPGEPLQITAEDDPNTSDIDETGQYQFTNLLPGTYIVREVVPEGFEQTFPGGSIVNEDGVSVTGPLTLIQPQQDIAATFIGNAGVSADGLGTTSVGNLQAEIPLNSTVEYAFLHVATRRANDPFRPTTIGFEGSPQEISWLNIAEIYGINVFETGRVDVTSIVASKVGNGGGIFDFTVDERVTGAAQFVEGTSLTVIYSNPSLPERTIVLLEGGLTGPEPQTNVISLANPVDKTNSDFTAEMALGIQYGFLPQNQYSTVDVNGERLTSSAGNPDDGFGANGALITVGGVGDSSDNPIDPLSTTDASDDELYDLSPFLNNGDTLIQLETANPSNDDSIFLVILNLPGAGNISSLNTGHLVKLQSGEVVENINFGNVQKNAEISGIKWQDINGNGVRDADDPGLAGTRIYLDLNNNGLFDSNEPRQITAEDDPNTPDIDETGQYRFTDLLAGTYTVREIISEGFSQTFPLDSLLTDFYTVELAAGEIAENFNFGNAIIGAGDPNFNFAPTIVSNPIVFASKSQNYVYDVNAIDRNDDTLTYSLINAPDGMVIDPVTGEIVWETTTQSSLASTNNVTVQVEDGRGGIDTQRFSVVLDTEPPEVFLGFNGTVIDLGQPLDLQIQGFDNVGLDNLDLAFDGTSLNLDTDTFQMGFVYESSITPTEAGLFEVLATATDTSGNTDTTSITVRVVDRSDTEAPTIDFDTSAFRENLALGPNGFISDDGPFNLGGSLEVLQPDNDNVATFTGRAGISSDGLGTLDGEGILEVEIPDGSTIEHAFLHVGTLTVDNGFRPNEITFEDQSVGLSWLDNVQDVVTTTKTLNYEIGRADVTSIIADKVGNSGGLFEFTLDERLDIIPGRDLIVGSSLTVVYSNPDLPESTIVLLEGGAIGPQPRTTNLSFTNPLDLSNSEVTPQLSLGILFGDLATRQYTTVDVNGDRLTSSAGDFDDGVRENYGLVTVGGVGDTLDNPEDVNDTRDFEDDELYNLTPFLADGDTELTIETRNISDDDLLFLMALVLPDSVEDINITNPDPQGFSYNKLLTTATDIVADVSDDNFESYRVEYAPLSQQNDPSAYRVISQGDQAPTDGVLGQIDPSLLANGDYNLRIVASDKSGNIQIEQTAISVEGSNKPGRFALDFTDLSIPLTGIPIEITRRYDSLESNIEGDFGQGWSLGLEDARIEESSPLGFDLSGRGNIFTSNPFSVGTRVTLDTPDGRRVGFTFEPKLLGAGAGRFLGPGFYVWEPYFRPDPGVYETLETNYMPLMINPDGTTGLYLFNFSFNPNQYQLTTRDGTVYNYHQQDGLQDVVDRNGNTLTFSNDGIISSTGVSVDFVRDSQGRITEIIDPEGNSLLYTYDSEGNLVGFSDRTDNETIFKYEGEQPHYLTEIIDPLGRTGVRTEYDENGQISAIIDANSNALDINYDTAASRQTIEDPFGNTTTLIFDIRGNVVSEIDALGGVTERTYDENDNILTETDPEGNTTTYTYDERGNVLSVTDGEGNTTTSTYNEDNDLLSETDALGNTTTNVYDDKGNLTRRTDAEGNVTTYEYDQFGLLTALTDANGNESQFSYDRFGNLTNLVDPTGATLTFSYDRNGNPISLTDPLGNVFTTTYDNEGRIISQTDPEGNACGCGTKGITRTEYNAAGDKIAEIDALGNRTEYVYNDRGLLIETIYPDATPDDLTDNPRIKNEYDALDRVIVTTDEEERNTHYVYDALGREIEVIYADETPNDLSDNPRTFTEYDGVGHVIAEIDELGNRTEFEYDQANNLVLQRDALGNETRFIYDAAQRQVATIDALGRRTDFVYDGLDRLIETQYADGTTTTSTYDGLGYMIAETDQNGITTEFEYDALGRLTAVIDALGQRTEYGRDLLGNILTQTDANGHVTEFEYDSLSRLTATILPLGQRSQTTYDAVGNVVATTDYNGDTITYEYDERNRLITTTLPDGEIERFTYTGTGQVAEILDQRGFTNYNYDVRDRLLSRSEPDGRTIEYTYDDAGNILTLTVPSGQTSYEYDALNRLATVIDPNGGQTTYTYNPVGNLITTEFANGVTETRDYDLLNRLTYLENRNGDGILSSYTYTLDAVGYRIKVEEADGTVVEYDYDDLYRLTQETISDPDNGVQTIEYRYDPVGNRLQRIDSQEGTTTYSYDANDRLLWEVMGGDVTEYEYDDNGNLTARVVNGEDQASYEWNAKGELVAIEITENGETGRIEYEYNTDGIRVGIIVNGEETRFLIDMNQQEFAQVIEEYLANGDTVASYVHGNDLIAKEDSNGQIFYQVDGLGSTRSLTDINGELIHSYEYDAYGNLTESLGSVDNNYLFAGEQFDSHLEGYYLRARYYDNETGRFVSRDPFTGFNEQPMTLHDYLYGNANPVNFVDPSGESIFAERIAARGFFLGTIEGYAYTINNLNITSRILAITGFIHRYLGNLSGRLTDLEILTIFSAILFYIASQFSETSPGGPRGGGPGGGGPGGGGPGGGGPGGSPRTPTPAPVPGPAPG